MMGRSQPILGTSLIETTVMLAVIGALLGMSVKVMTSAGIIHADAVRAVTELRSTQALAARLRSDAARAAAAEASESGQLSLRSSDERRVDYRVHSERSVIRELWIKDELIGQDRWQFSQPVRFTATVTSRTEPEAEEPTLVRVTLASRSTRSDEATTVPQLTGGPSWLEVVARVGTMRIASTRSEAEIAP